MKVFVSYSFNDANKWVEDLVIPLARALGLDVVTGQRMEGEPLIEGVDTRVRGCSGCIAFTTRRGEMRADGSYETHPWVMTEMVRARTLNIKTVEVREEGVRLGDESEAYVRIKYTQDKREKTLVDLAAVLASWVVRPVRIQLLPPDEDRKKFISTNIHGAGICTYELRNGSDLVKSGEALIQPIQGGFFIDIEKPPTEAIVKLHIKKPNDGGAWMSSGEGLSAIPIQLYDKI